VGLRQAVAGLERYIAGGAHGKRLLLAWCQPSTLASNATFVFAFEDDYAMGVLLSSLHRAWAKSRSSTLEDRLRYTSSTVFASFPWPYPVTDEQRESISVLTQSLIKRRQELCIKNNFGLTALYNSVDEGAYADIKKLHEELNDAVATAYGWPKATVHDDDKIVQLLLDLNREIVAGKRPYDPFDEQANLGTVFDFR
jgi:hypothetical protein